MKKWIVVPKNKVGEIEFGMDREQVRALFYNKPAEFLKTPFSKSLTDDFSFCHVYYNIEGKCEAVEIFADFEIDIDGKTILPNDINILKGLAKDLNYDGYGYISESLSIGITLDDDDHIESILFGITEYYN